MVEERDVVLDHEGLLYRQALILRIQLPYLIAMDTIDH